MTNILVIGASGFVGGYLTRQLLGDGYTVRCLARNPDKFKDLADTSCETVKKKFNAPVKFKYGQQEYDFDEGVLSFMSPGQVSGFDPQNTAAPNNRAGCC